MKVRWPTDLAIESILIGLLLLASLVVWVIGVMT